LEANVEDGHGVVVFESHGGRLDVVESDSAVPGGNEQEFGCIRAELHGRDAIVRRVFQLEFCPTFAHGDSIRCRRATDVVGGVRKSADSAKTAPNRPKDAKLSGERSATSCILYLLAVMLEVALRVLLLVRIIGCSQWEIGIPTIKIRGALIGWIVFVVAASHWMMFEFAGKCSIVVNFGNFNQGF
jgi:hypothetical protein